MKWAIYITVSVIIIVLIIFLVSGNKDKNQNVKSMNNNTELMLSESGRFQYANEQGWQKVSFDIKNNDVINVIDANDLCTSVGKWVKIEGVSQSRKLGAVVVGNDYHVWIDIPDYWPRNVEGQKIQAIGIMEERYDLPVFIPKPGEPAMQGIPVPEGTDLHKASHRYVIQNAIISLSSMTDINEEVPMEVKKLLVELNGWYKDQLDLVECSDKYPNYSSDGETEGWVNVHKQKLKELGFIAKWNSNKKIYELIKKD
jgi:hypothetical protein